MLRTRGRTYDRSRPNRSKRQKSACHRGPSTYDDWGLANLTPDQGRDLLEIVDDRHGRGSTVVTSQLPVENWHEVIANPTVADAILDRLVHNAHRLTLKGDSLRKAAAKRAGLDVNQAA
jgi:IstB-like ATP binding protein